MLVLVTMRSRASHQPLQTTVPEDASQLTLENAESRLAHSHPTNHERSPAKELAKAWATRSSQNHSRNILERQCQPLALKGPWLRRSAVSKAPASKNGRV